MSTQRMPRQLRRQIQRGLAAKLLQQILGRGIDRRTLRIGARAYANHVDRVSGGSPQPRWHKYTPVVLNQQLVTWLTERTSKLYA